jgi:hypothetical protein
MPLTFEKTPPLPPERAQPWLMLKPLKVAL